MTIDLTHPFSSPHHGRLSWSLTLGRKVFSYSCSSAERDLFELAPLIDLGAYARELVHDILFLIFVERLKIDRFRRPRFLSSGPPVSSSDSFFARLHSEAHDDGPRGQGGRESVMCAELPTIRHQAPVASCGPGGIA